MRLVPMRCLAFGRPQDFSPALSITLTRMSASVAVVATSATQTRRCRSGSGAPSVGLISYRRLLAPFVLMMILVLADLGCLIALLVCLQL